MNESGKINIKLPFFILEKLENDAITFNITKNKIFNEIYRSFKNKYKGYKIEINGKYDKKKSFTLNKANHRDYIDIIMGKIYVNNDINEAEYFRDLFYQYSILPIFEREKILFKNNFEKLEKAINEKRKIKLYSKNRVREFNPYFIKQSEEFNYIFGYCELRNDYRIFRVSNIKEIDIYNEKIIEYNKEQIEKYKENFDPFLSSEKRVKVKFTEYGIEKYNKIVSNRPKIIKKENNIYLFECSEKKAQVYFPQFFTDVEILEPKSLRKWYKEKLEKALKTYTKDYTS
ncbi:MAG: hypothetical protein PWP46_1499 [Fusobacteriaceae bacterium]|jgi:hypothetical protein|nr:hypothetical protein [Fusobacteriaceae bacterium]